MPFLVLLIGALLIIAGYRNTAGDLASALETDAPKFATWALAVAGIGALQWVPGLRIPARWLLALVILVIVLRNYQAVLDGFTSLRTLPGASTAPVSPAQAYVANPTSPNITPAEITGTTGGTTGGGTAGGTAGNINALASGTVTNPLASPATYLQAYESGFGGFA
jgi:hypothetical protein